MISPAARIPIIWSFHDVKGRLTLSHTSVVFPSSVTLMQMRISFWNWIIVSFTLLQRHKRKLSRLYDPFWRPSVPFGLVLTFIEKKLCFLTVMVAARLICWENSFFVSKLQQKYFSHIKWTRFSLHHLRTFDALPSSITFTSNLSAHSFRSRPDVWWKHTRQ